MRRPRAALAALAALFTPARGARPAPAAGRPRPASDRARLLDQYRALVNAPHHPYQAAHRKRERRRLRRLLCYRGGY